MSLKEVSASELVEFKGNKKGIIVNIKRVVKKIRNYQA